MSDKPQLDLSIVIVNWNSVAFLRECIASIRQQTHGIAYEIVVVDNASPAGDAEVIEKELENIILIKSDRNLGFAGGNNLAFTRASGEYLLFLNPDTKLLGPAINLMLCHLQGLPDGGIIGCRLLNGDLSLQTSSIQRFPTILNRVLESEYLRRRWPGCPLWGISALFADHGAPSKVESISGACMMMRRQVFEAVGFFTEDYFMYAEDLDLCWKVRRAGFASYYVPEATVVHHAGKSSRPEWAVIMKVRSELRFCRIHRGRAYGVAFRSALVINAMGRFFILSVLGVLKNGVERREAVESTRKWRTILRALLTDGKLKDQTLMVQKSVLRDGGQER